jgi:hypothetical protein
LVFQGELISLSFLLLRILVIARFLFRIVKQVPELLLDGLLRRQVLVLGQLFSSFEVVAHVVNKVELMCELEVISLQYLRKNIGR